MVRKLLLSFFVLIGFGIQAQVANQPEDLFICDEAPFDGFAIFDLTFTTAEILGAQDPTDFVITFHVSLTDAQSGINAIPNPQTYFNTTNPQTIYARLERISDGMFDTTNFDITVLEPPLDPGVLEMFLCDDELNGSTPDDEISTFNLTTQDAVATGGDTSLVVTWYETLADEAADNPIADPTSYQNTSNPQTVIGRITSPFDCRTVFTLTLTVLPNPTPTTPTPLVVCDFDGDGFADFSLHDKDIEITGGEPSITITYHETLVDADAGILELISPYSNIVPFVQIVYARVESDITGCFEIVELELQAIPIPDEPDSSFVNPMVNSDTDGDGMEAFDLTVNDAPVLGTQDPSDFEITYHVTSMDADFDLNPIITPENFLSSGQTIWVRLESLTTGCYRVTPFDIVVEGIILAQQPVDVFVNEGDDNGLAIFDLTTQEDDMLGTLDPAIHQFTYHITLSDSNNNENAIANPEAYQNIANPQTIYVRLTNTDNGFYVLTNFQIETDGVLGVSDLSSLEIVVYPNPAEQIIHVQSSEELTEIEINVYDMNGRSLIFKNEQYSLDVSQLPAGMYWIQLRAQEGKFVKPLVKK